MAGHKGTLGWSNKISKLVQHCGEMLQVAGLGHASGLGSICLPRHGMPHDPPCLLYRRSERHAVFSSAVQQRLLSYQPDGMHAQQLTDVTDMYTALAHMQVRV